jgi:hypothetical protein
LGVLEKLRVRLQPVVSNINLPTVIKTAILPGDSYERLFIATQTGEIIYTGKGGMEQFLDIRSRIIKLGTLGGGYDERGLLGLAFHPMFEYNGLFYLHYSLAGTQGPGALPVHFIPDPCDPEINYLMWTNRENQFDHIDTVEEWILLPGGQRQKRRTLLNIRRPFANHNGVNSLNFSPETGRLVLTTGDGGAGYDPFNLSQDIMEIAGKIIEIDVNKNRFVHNTSIATRFNELPLPVQETLSVIAKGVRNIPGISFKKLSDGYVKYTGNVGQNLVESIYSFVDYKPIPVTQITQSFNMNTQPAEDGLINLGWRGWEGDMQTSVIRNCPDNPQSEEITAAYYNDAVIASTKRILPLTCYYHIDPRPDKFEGTALTGVKPYMGNAISNLTDNVVFIDFARKSQSPVRGGLAYTKARSDCKQNDYGVIDIDYNFGPASAYYVSLGTNLDQTRLFLGVYGSAQVTNLNRGTVFEIVP